MPLKTLESDNVSNYLSMMRDFRLKSLNSKLVYPCFEDLVLTYGKPYKELMPRPKWVRKGIIKQCYHNCLKALIKHPDKLIYCEGFALGIIPVMHAWLLYEGKVIDPTWENGQEYFGIAFKTAYVFRIAKETGYSGVIDNWHQRFPLLTGEDKPEEFLL